MRIIIPSSQSFGWSSDASLSPILVATDADGPHSWIWTLSWRDFTASDTVQTESNTWDASSVLTNGGGVLTIVAQSSGDSATTTLTIVGVNPTTGEITDFLADQPHGPDFARILQHESGARNFDHSGAPIVSFDHGYGMCQLTTPKPTLDQIWNWKSNVLGGLALFAAKRSIATAYLGQAGRRFTESQLLYETVSLWNGGHYHVFTSAGWVRNPNILCDSKTGNMGWDMTDPANSGRSEAALHARDAASYSRPPVPGVAHWKYLGTCYADHILGPPGS